MRNKRKNDHYNQKYLWWKQDLKYTYNLTVDDYNAMYNKQDGCCAICNRHQSEFKQRLCVDHNHETGQIRGLLCHSCNTKLGWLEKHMENIKAYVK